MPKSKLTIAVYILLRALVIVVLILQLFNRQWANVFMCVLTLFLFMVPSLLEKRLKIDLPNLLEIIILLFIFAAEILGEIAAFYVRISFWDTMLHTTNGFLMAAIGFTLIDILNRSPKFHISLSPLFVAFVAFCFSMTIGILWEFFEFSADRLFLSDMQKDYYVSDFSTVMLDTTNTNDAVPVRDISGVSIHLADGEDIVIDDGYLDIGITDTMKDLFVNCIGALVFSVIGAFYISRRGGSIAQAFIPVMLTDEEAAHYANLEKDKRKRKRPKR